MRELDIGLLEILAGLYSILLCITYYKYVASTFTIFGQIFTIFGLILISLFSVALILRGLMNMKSEEDQRRFVAAVAYNLGILDLDKAAKMTGMKTEQFQKFADEIRKRFFDIE